MAKRSPRCRPSILFSLLAQRRRQGQLDAIYAYYKNGNSAEAEAAAARYIRLYPRGPHVDYAYYMKGLIEFKSGSSILQRAFHQNPAPHDLSAKKEAFNDFAQIVNFYPNSPYAYDAAMRMAYIRNIIAEKSVLIANYYLSRKAYVAAANRAAYVVQHFEGSPEVKPALVTLIKAYEGLGLTEMAAKTERIYTASYGA